MNTLQATADTTIVPGTSKAASVNHSEKGLIALLLTAIVVWIAAIAMFGFPAIILTALGGTLAMFGWIFKLTLQGR